MSFWGWGTSKRSKVEGVSFDEMKWLQKSLRQVLENEGLLKCNSEALKAAVECQTYTIQKLEQELRSCKVKNTLTDKWTLTDHAGYSEDTCCSDDAMSSDSVTEDDLCRETNQKDTENNLDPPSRQENILVKLLLNNQTVLLNQAIVIQKAVLNSTQLIQNLQQHMDSWFSQNVEPSLNEQDKKYQALEDEKFRLNQRCKVTEEEKNQLNVKCKKLEEEKNKLGGNFKKLEEEKNQLSTKCKELEEFKKEFEKLRRSYEILSTENNYLKNQALHSSSSSRPWFPVYNPAPQKKLVRFQLYCPRKTDLTDNVMTQLTTMLKYKMDLLGLELYMINCESTSQINGSLPLVVICLYASRLGTDVLNAMQGVPVNPNVAVLVLHRKDIYALPAQTSDKILTGDEYRNIGTILDMAFLSGKGFYTCNMNDRGLDDLTNFIKRHSNL